ncbi:hypothetical protein VSR68_03370 [Paraburkholderia phymatum]|uniref:hypothetical protein n=1 Tax=Paraburkholderia phymatum TaxID=148447 RepID=UPI00317AEB13
MATLTITPFQGDVLTGKYPGGVGEQLGSVAAIYEGAGTITGVSGAGTFSLYDSTTGAYGKPLISFGSNYEQAVTGQSIAFTNGLFIVANGKNSDITITITTA